MISTIQSSYTGTCPASFGELLQGVLPEDNPFLVTLPITAITRVCFYPQLQNDIIVFPNEKTKTRRFIEKIKEKHSLDFSGIFVVESGVCEGKGLSSSTADMVAAAKALESYCECCFEPTAVEEVLREIEPSDGLLYPGSNVYNHCKCQFIQHLGFLPKMAILSIDFGGTIDTVGYNKKKKYFSLDLQIKYQHLLDELIIAFQNKDLLRIGKIATQSSILNQEFNYKSQLNVCIELADKYGAYGIVNTHSGTCLGFLLDVTSDALPLIAGNLLEIFPQYKISLYYTS